MTPEKKVFWVDIFIVLLSFLAFGIWFFSDSSYGPAVADNNTTSERDAYRLPAIYSDQSKVLLVGEEVGISKSSQTVSVSKVPFTSQAPFAQWDEDIFQGACEESSVIMTMHWVRGTDFTAQEATNKIRALAEFQKKNYGYFYDTSAVDTFKFFAGYFSYNNVELIYDIDGADIRAQIDKGNIVIVPINGQKVNNPYYVPPGPIAHMLVVVDYDKDTNEFVTHDPGTKHGSGFRYSYGIFENALADYPTGYHEPITSSRTAMIIVSKPSNTTSSY